MNFKRIILALFVLSFNCNAYAASVRVSGFGIYYPSPYPQFVGFGSPTTIGVVDATNKKLAVCGRMFWESRTGTFAINKVAFKPGAVTDTGGSVTRVSLQDIDISTGPPTRPDGTDDQFVDISSTVLTANTWVLSGALDSDRTVAYNEWVCVVWKYNPAGRLGSDLFNVQGLPLSSGNFADDFAIAVSSLSVFAPWTRIASLPIVVFEDASGNAATLNGVGTLNATTAANFTSATTPDEKGNGFYLPFPSTVDAIWGYPIFTAANTVSGIYSLYQGTTLLQSVTISSTTLGVAGAGQYVIASIPETDLTANTTYYISFKPNAAVNVQMGVNDWTKHEYKELSYTGSNFGYSQRTDNGAWSVIESTRAAYLGVRLTKFDNGAGGVAPTTKGWTYAQ